MRKHSYENDFDLHENETARRTHFQWKVSHLGQVQTPYFTWAESNANDKNPLFSLISIRFGSCEVRRLNRASGSFWNRGTRELGNGLLWQHLSNFSFYGKHKIRLDFYALTFKISTWRSIVYFLITYLRFPGKSKASNENQEINLIAMSGDHLFWNDMSIWKQLVVLELLFISPCLRCFLNISLKHRSLLFFCKVQAV